MFDSTKVTKMMVHFPFSFHGAMADLQKIETEQFDICPEAT